jgi:type IV pilus assembly protein PilC
VEFRCRVASATGQVLEATYVADTEERLRQDLEEKGLHLIAVRGGSGRGVGIGRFRLQLPRRRSVPAPDFMVFNQELATLLRAGLPLVQSLDILRRRVPNPLFRSALDDIYERVRSGASLSDAFEQQQLFSGVYTASLMAGEKSGGLEQVVRRYVAHMKVLNAARAQVVSALIYPVVLVLLASTVVLLIVFKVVPEFAEFYASFGHGAELPLLTQIVVAISHTLVNDAPFIAIGFVVCFIIGFAWFRRPTVRRRIDAFTLRLPYFGPLTRKFATAQVSRTLATLLAGGIPLVNALDVSSKATGNRSIADHLTGVARQVREGGSLGQSLAERNIFPHVAVEMVEVGESTGALADMLNSVADFYDEENETSLARFSNLIQPLLLIVMGVIIAALLLSLYMPLFKLSSLSTG